AHPAGELRCRRAYHSVSPTAGAAGAGNIIDQVVAVAVDTQRGLVDFDGGDQDQGRSGSVQGAATARAWCAARPESETRSRDLSSAACLVRRTLAVLDTVIRSSGARYLSTRASSFDLS